MLKISGKVGDKLVTCIVHQVIQEGVILSDKVNCGALDRSRAVEASNSWIRRGKLQRESYSAIK